MTIKRKPPPTKTPEQVQAQAEKEISKIPLGWAWLKSGKKLQRPEHLYKISEALYKVYTGEIKRLMIFAPPRHFKSDLISIRFPAFWFESRPDDYIIIVSYGQELATKFGREVRDLVNEHGRHKISEDSAAKHRWNIEGHPTGGMFCVGFDGAITGRGGNLIIIDDPHKDSDEALNPTALDDKFQKYLATIYNRLEPNGAIILDMQRWHVNDLAGRIQEHAKETGEVWHVLSLPAICDSDETGEPDPIGRKPGEPLDPVRYDKEALAMIQKNTGWWWYAQYQQRPLQPENQTVNPAWFPRIEKVPHILQAVRYFDMAAKPQGRTNTGDYAAGVLTVKDIDLRYGIPDIRRVRKTAAGIEDLMAQTVRADFDLLKRFELDLLTDEEKIKRAKDPVHWQEIFDKRFLMWFMANYVLWFESDTGGTGEIAAAYLQRHLREKSGYNISIKYEHPSGAKYSRAQPMFNQAMGGNYWIWGEQLRPGMADVVGVWDISGFKTRLSVFGPDTNKDDDEIDGASGGNSKLLHLIRPDQRAHDYGLGWV